MANLSDAQVTIYAEKVGRELLDYIKETQKTYTDYQIVYDGHSEELDDDGNLTIQGNSSGRWSYQNNIEGYFSDERVKQWLGVTSDYSYIPDPKQREMHVVQANKSYAAYVKLIKAIKKTGGRVDIEYTDSDTAMDWMGEGVATLELVDGEVRYSHNFEEQRITIAEYAKQQGESEFWALEYIHGDEVATAYDNYLKGWEKHHSGPEFEGMSPAGPDEWLDNEYKEE